MARSRTNRLKILMTVDTVGGVWRYSLDLCSRLARCGVKIVLATMGPLPSDGQRQEARSIPNLTLRESEYALEWMEDPWRDVDLAGTWLLTLASEERVDLIHLNGYAHASLPWDRPVIVVAHSCVRSWWRNVLQQEAGCEWAEYGGRVRRGLEAASRIVAPSAAMADSLAADYTVDRERIQVIYNFSRSNPIRRCGKQPFILAAGRVWDPAKNMKLLEEIAPALRWPMRIAGQHQPDGQQQSSAACYLGLLTAADMHREFQMASLFAHPAFYEPFGLSVLEAARAKCCLVLADVPSLRELWEGAAVFIDPRDPAKWVRELNDLALDSERRRRLAASAANHAGRYRAASSVAAYLRIYCDLVGSGTGNQEGVAA